MNKSFSAAGLLALSPFRNLLANENFKRVEKLSPLETASDEDFWAMIRQAYSISDSVIYMNNAGLNPQPKSVAEALINNYAFSNEAPTYNMWHELDRGRESLRAKLANLCGCSTEEIAINRNSTEGLNTVIFGLNLKAGDEVVLSKYDYPNMMNAWKQRESRDGIKLNWIEEFDFPLEDEQKIIDTYVKAITPKTKIVHITHLINWTGQIVPAKKIADIAHQKGCEVIVDGAQSFAHIDFKIPDLGSDYFATSLHKWLGAPFGTGLLYIKKEKIKNIWPLLSAPDPASEGITKFENLGGRSYDSEMAISNAIDFHLLIGGARKEARLRYLKDYWYNKVKNIPKVKLYTSMNPQFSCGIATFGIDGWSVSQIYSTLYGNKIIASPMEYLKLHGTRVSPNVFTSTYELDLLIQQITEMAVSSPPKAEH